MSVYMYALFRQMLLSNLSLVSLQRLLAITKPELDLEALKNKYTSASMQEATAV